MKRAEVQHITRRHNDTIYCERCSKSWDVADKDVPPCESTARVKYINVVRNMGHLK